MDPHSLSASMPSSGTTHGQPLRVTARPAPLAIRHFEQVWGTVVGIDVRDQAVRGLPEPLIRNAIAEVVHWLHRVDRIFSTFRDDSLVSAYRRYITIDAVRGEVVDVPGWLATSFDPLDVGVFGEVVQLCEQARTSTGGVFDPWAVPGGFDPSGLVKGWAVQRAAQSLQRLGLQFFAIDGSGDIVCRGGEDVAVPWHIGIQHPDRRDAVMKTVRMFSGATATSGTYVQGDHIVNPMSAERGLAGRAATVVGSDAVWCEVWATTAVVLGVRALEQVHSLGSEWSALVVEEERVSIVGDAFV